MSWSTAETILDYIRDTIAAINGTAPYRENFAARPGSVTIGQPTQPLTMRSATVALAGIPSVEPMGTRQVRIYLTMQIACYTGAMGQTPEVRIFDALGMASDVHRAIMLALQSPSSPALYGRMDGLVGDAGSDTGTATMQVTCYYHTDGAL